MEGVSEESQLLSEIEQSIQNTLALFNLNDLGEVDHLSHNNVASSTPNSQIQDSSNDLKTQNSQGAGGNDLTRSASPVKESYSYSKASIKNNISSNESIAFPFLENPIQNTIEEMQRVLNTTCSEATPFLKSPPLSPSIYETSGFYPPTSSVCRTSPLSPTQEHSPEDILNIFSQDLGICPSNSPSPRMESNYQLSDDDHKKSKSNKRDKIIYKKHKPKKLKIHPDKKLDIKKNKINNVENLPSKEIKLKELMNIYGCPDKIKKRNSDSTLGSKSGINKNTVSKPSLNMNATCKASSMTVSKKGMKKKMEAQDDLSADYISLEKTSKLSVKRKLKQRNSTSAKVSKKQNLKRKIETNLSSDKIENRLSKGYPNSHPSINHKLNNSNCRNSDIKYQKQIKPNNCMKTDQDEHYEINTGKIEPIKNTKTTILKAIPHTKHQHGVKQSSKLNNSEIQHNKNLISNRQSQDKIEHADLNNNNFLMKKISDETKLNKQVLFTGSNQNNFQNDVSENRKMSISHTCYDSTNGDFFEPSLHYTLPTHSSRSKEVERFLNGSFQNLPFVIGQSTNKSHNLWVNIQEALSLIKQKIPEAVEVQNVVDYENNDRPISVISKLTSKSVKKPHQCPALNGDVLYDIPEVNEAGNKSWENHPYCLQANIDPDNVRPRCSCLSQSSLSYKKVLRQLFGGRYSSLSDFSGDVNSAREDFLQDQGDSYTNELRKVLVNFTQEFEQLNNKYEEMLKDPNVPKKELEQLETTLQSKEEEIKDIIVRFQEVREINEKTRLESSKSRTGLCTLEAYKSTTSVRLAQTLRRVQQFKETLKNRPSVPYLTKNFHVQNVLA